MKFDMRSKFLVGFVSFLLLLGASTALLSASKASVSEPESVVDDETVYVLLDARGAPKKTIVVNWLRIRGNGEFRVYDVKPDAKIEVLKNTPEPSVKDGSLVFEIESKSFKDIYYQVETEKKLPLEFDIRYELNGKSIEPEKLAGKSGHLKVSLKIKNNLKKSVVLEYKDQDNRTVRETTEVFVPLFTVVSLNLDSSKFDNIELENGWLSAQGSKFALSWFAFPQGEAEISFEADGKNIEIPSIMISAMPRLPQEFTIDMADEFEKLYKGLNGLSMLSEAHQTILTNISSKIDPSSFSKLSSATNQFSKLNEAIVQMKDGINGITQLTEAQIMLLDGLIQSLENSSSNDIMHLIEAISQVKNGLISIKSGIDSLISLVGVYEQLTQQAYDLNQMSTEKVDEIISQTTITADLVELKNMLENQNQLLGLILLGGEDSSGNSILPFSQFKENLISISSSLDQIITACSQVEQGSSNLASISDGLTNLKNSLITLRDGGIIGSNYLPGLKMTKESLTQISRGMEMLKAGTEKAVSSFGMLQALPGSLLQIKSAIETVAQGGYMMGKNVPGISTTKLGLDGMKLGIGSGLKEMRRGQAYNETLKSEADRFDTFLGRYTEDNYSGRVRFIFKVDEISKK
jgi:putative membrane protein